LAEHRAIIRQPSILRNVIRSPKIERFTSEVLPALLGGR